MTDAELVKQLIKVLVTLEKYCESQEIRYCKSKEERKIGRHECYTDMKVQFAKHKKLAQEGKM